eukprot:gnl/MRDRNA2_/MRDRNA2_184761_c0_seq1.p1 gnl/MRDRNA2_/MRDRNA2_184761_c0~~gnl/MRDRNA2_/MRDRNA2_184761_c0_seq1.p1  ORF type:complete len:405 (-),score=69.73 gnl/MRDRNA2_/MRDRNA2_184761_c0_seq1:31-1185(-)
MGDAAHPMCPFRAQGANQALADAVLLADVLEDSVRKHGPQNGLDFALPVFEEKMLRRSGRLVIASREKAKELHSSLALQPARKVQRESGVDMPEVLRVLRAKGIGAHSANDPRGLDAVVAENSSLGEFLPVVHSSSTASTVENKSGVHSCKKRKRSQIESGTAPSCVDADSVVCDGTQTDLSKIQKIGGDVVTNAGMARAGASSAGYTAGDKLWGFVDDSWHKCRYSKLKRNGKFCVIWDEDNTTSTLSLECVERRHTTSKNSKPKAKEYPQIHKKSKRDQIDTGAGSTRINAAEIVRGRKTDADTIQRHKAGAVADMKMDCAKGSSSGYNAGDKLWGFIDDHWHKCRHSKTKRNGNIYVIWEEDETTSVLTPDCAQRRVKRRS